MSLGEAFAAAFNSTYGGISQARLRNAQADMLRGEMEREDAYRAGSEVLAQKRDMGVQLGRPAGGEQPSAAPAEGAQPVAAATPSGGVAPNYGRNAGAVAARDNQPGDPEGAAAASVARTTTAGVPEGSYRANPGEGGVFQGAQPPTGRVAALDPSTPPAQSSEGSAPRQRMSPDELAKEMDKPGGALLAGVAGVAENLGSGENVPIGTLNNAANALARNVRQASENPGQPTTRRDWNGYYEAQAELARRTLGPRESIAVVADLDRARQAGLNSRLGLAVAAAGAGNLEAAARALNSADEFLPDGFRTQFRVVQGGLEMIRQPEEGGGQAQRVTLTPDQISQYATRMMDPRWALTHELAVRSESNRNEVARGNLAVSQAGEARAGRAERRAETDATNSAAHVRAQADLEDAQAALRNAKPEEREAAQAAVTAAQARLRETRANAPAAAVTGVSVMQDRDSQRLTNETLRREAIEAQNARAEAARRSAEEGRTRLQGDAATRFDTAWEDASTRRGNPLRGADNQLTPLGRRVRDQAEPFAVANRDVSPDAIIDMLTRARDPNSGVVVRNGKLVDTNSGLQLTIPERLAAGGRGTVAPEGGTAPTPPARGQGRGVPSGRQGASTGSRETPAPRDEGAAPPAAAPAAPRQGTGVSSSVRRGAGVPPNALAQAADEAHNTNARTPAEIEAIARRRGVDVGALNYRLRTSNRAPLAGTSENE